MLRLIWVEGILSWTVVGVVLFCSLSLIALDLAWRVLKIQFDTLLIYAFASDVTAAIVVILPYSTGNTSSPIFRLGPRHWHGDRDCDRDAGGGDQRQLWWTGSWRDLCRAGGDRLVQAVVRFPGGGE
ncbi:MAG: hypothetical protein ACREFU_07495, partial [Acetobacteraceae bacterium]